MLIISDGQQYGISATFPLPYGFLSKVGLFERQRWIRLSPIFALLGVALSAVFLVQIILHPAPTDAAAFLANGATGLILLKQFFQKKVFMRKEDARVVGIAPPIVWIEHLVLCFALGLAGLWANRLMDKPLFAPTLFLLFPIVAFIGAVWPFLNLLYLCRRG